jgi:hypothetical protein
MNILKTTRALAVICVCILLQNEGRTQGSLVIKTAGELVEALIQKGGQQAAEQLAELGGEPLAASTIAKATQEGGEQLVQKVADLTLENGPGILKIAEQSPSKFVAAFDGLTPATQKAAVAAINREPELMARLFSNIGKDSLAAAAQYPGVGTQVMGSLGSEGAETLLKMTTEDEAIQLGKLAPQIAKVAEPERKSLLEMIGHAPARMFALFKKHPIALASTAAIITVIAAKDSLIGDGMVYVDKKGHVNTGILTGICAMILDTISTPLSAVFWIAGLLFLLWGLIKLWAVFRLAKAKVATEQARTADETLKN